MESKDFHERRHLSQDKSSKYYVEDLNYPVIDTEVCSGLKLIDNCLTLPPFVINLDVIKSMSVRRDDTFVIGFPKSGTTWLEEIAWLINNNLDFDLATNQPHFERVPFIDSGFSHQFLDDFRSPRTIKTHLPIKYLPDNLPEKARVVYIVRNPKDALVSFFHFGKSLTAVKDTKHLKNIEIYTQNFLDGTVEYGAWWSHCDQYAALKNILFIQYEDLLENTFEMVKKLAAFLGKTYTDDQIRQLVAFTSFKTMKEKNQSFCKQMIEINVFEKDMQFFRQGKIGDWRNHLSEETSKKVDELVEEKLKCKLTFNYGE